MRFNRLLSETEMGENKKPIDNQWVCVVWAGIEPATQGFSVLCSTD